MEILRMGGYGLYVWSSYTLAVVSLASVVVILIMQKRRHIKRLQQEANESLAATSQSASS